MLACLNNLHQQLMDEKKVPAPGSASLPRAGASCGAAVAEQQLPPSSSVVVAFEKPQEPEKLSKSSVKSFMWAPGGCERPKEQMSCVKCVEKLLFHISLCRAPFGVLC